MRLLRLFILMKEDNYYIDVNVVQCNQNRSNYEIARALIVDEVSNNVVFIVTFDASVSLFVTGGGSNISRTISIDADYFFAAGLYDLPIGVIAGEMIDMPLDPYSRAVCSIYESGDELDMFRARKSLGRVSEEYMRCTKTLLMHTKSLPHFRIGRKPQCLVDLITSTESTSMKTALLRRRFTFLRRSQQMLRRTLRRSRSTTLTPPDRMGTIFLMQ